MADKRDILHRKFKNDSDKIAGIAVYLGAFVLYVAIVLAL